MATEFHTTLDSPIGRLLLMANASGLHHIGFQDTPRALRPLPDSHDDAAHFHDICAQLQAYFAGTLRRFTLLLAPHGTAFQQRVWQALQAIPYGRTTSYGAVARQLDHPTAARAVGAANGQNPLPIIIPCHRVIGSTGALHGYAGGMDVKHWLLTHEGVDIPAP